MNWTPKAVEQLTELVEKGLSASQIAGELGTTRNTIIGKVHRIGLRLLRSPGWVSAREVMAGKPKEPKPKRVRRVRPKKPLPERSMLVPSIEVVAAPEPLIPPIGLSLMDLEAGDCRWPLGDQREPAMLFCGLGAAPGCSYCLQHKRLAYQPIQRGKKEPSALGQVHAFTAAWK